MHFTIYDASCTLNPSHQIYLFYLFSWVLLHLITSMFPLFSFLMASSSFSLATCTPRPSPSIATKHPSATTTLPPSSPQLYLPSQLFWNMSNISKMVSYVFLINQIATDRLYFKIMICHLSVRIIILCNKINFVTN